MESRKLSVIMFTDMVGYSRKVQENEDRALKLLQEHNDILDAQIKSNQGRVIKTIGDAFLADFDSVFNAVNCAVDIQKFLAQRNESDDPGRAIQVRIGIHVGDVIYREQDVFGDGVNIASRIESIAGPGQIYISHDIYSIALGKLTYGFKDLGAQDLKNITRPIRVYEVLWDPKRAGEATREPGAARPAAGARRRRWAVATVALALAVGAWVVFIQMPAPAVQSAARPTLALVTFGDQTGDEKLQQVRIGKIINDAILQKFYEFPYVQLVSPIRINKIIRDLKIDDENLADNPDLAEKIAREANGRLLITGNLKKVGKTFILSADLNDLKQEQLLATYVVREDRQENILGPMIDSLCDKFQRKIVEAFQVRDTMPYRVIAIEDLTTRSLVAYNHFIKAWENHEYGVEDEAIREINLAIAADSNFALAYSTAACIYSFAKKEDRMPAIYGEKITQLKDRFRGSSKEALIFQGNLAWLDNRVEDCGAAYRLLTELYPDDREAYYYHGLFLQYLKKDYAGAVKDYDKALTLTPDYYPIIRDLAYATKEIKGADEAVHILQKFIHDYPGNPGIEYARKQIAELRGVL